MRLADCVAPFHIRASQQSLCICCKETMRALGRLVEWAERRMNCEICGGAYFRFNNALDHRDDCLVPHAREALDEQQALVKDE